MRLFGLLLFVFTFAWSIEIDIDYLKKEIAQNTQNTKYRLIVARSYVRDGNYDDAKKLLDEVLLVDKKNQKAHFLLKDIKKLKEIKTLIKGNDFSQYFKELSNKKEYNEIISLIDVLKRNNIALNPDVEFYLVDSYINLKNYEKAEDVLKKSSLPLQDKHFMMAKIYEKKSNLELSEQEYKDALKSGDREDIVLGLYDLYIKQGKTKDAQELLKIYNSKDSKSSIAIALQKRDKKLLDKRLSVLEEDYKKEGSFDTLKQYYYALEGVGQKNKAISTLASYVKKHPKDEESFLFLAQIYSWDHKPKQAISVLKPIIKKTKNKDVLKIYVDSLLQINKREKAYSYMKRLASLGDSKSQKELEKINTNDILASAILAHKSKNYQRAIRYYKSYYSKTKDAKIAKEIAELSFVTKKAKESLSFYRAYLSKFPDDNKIRFRYASALDSLKKYQQSEVEYKKVAHMKDSLYSLATYRYASSLIAQKDEEKWNHSRAVLQNLHGYLQTQTPSKERNDLLKFTTLSLKKVSKPMPKPTRHKDIILAEGQKKIIDTEYTLAGSDILKRDISSVKSMLMPINVSVKEPTRKDVTLSFHSLEDDTISNISYGIRLNKIAKIANGTLSIEAKKSRFKTSGNKQNVDSFLTFFNYKDFSFGIGMSQFKKFNDIDVQMNYRKILAGHDMTFGLKSTNGAFINSNACSIDNKINVVQLSLYDAILLSNLDQAEVGLTLNRYDDENINLNSWAEYPIYKISYLDFENDISLSGSYEFNTKTDTCYYSAKFFDGTYIQTRPKILLGKKGFIQGIGGIGYSFESSDFLYNYGLSMELLISKFIEVRVDCRHYQSGYSPDGADECYATAAYKW